MGLPTLKRRWWDSRRVYQDGEVVSRDAVVATGGRFALISEAELDHVREAFAWLDVSAFNEWSPVALTIVGRGEDSEPQWGEYGRGPDEVGQWERQHIDDAGIVERGEVSMYVVRWVARFLQWCDLGEDKWSSPVKEMDHSCWRYRRVGG